MIKTPQVYIRESQYDALVALGFSTKDDLLDFVRDAIDAALKKEQRKRKRYPAKG